MVPYRFRISSKEASRYSGFTPKAATNVPPSPPADGKTLPLGTVVSSLPAGSRPVGGEECYYRGGNFYRAVFQGNNLVYVAAKP